MDEIDARLSKEQRILCGRQDATGRYVCDEPVAHTVAHVRPVGPPARHLVPLEGWALDRRKGVWHKTTSVEDRRKYGVPPVGHRVYPTLPALARCPKCRAVQWLDPVRLHIARGPNY